MFELMTKMHPYVNQKGPKKYQDYALCLKNSQLNVPSIVNNFSAPMQGLFDLVVRMVGKSQKNRASCQ
jgi:hypothetical protein